MHRPIHTIPLTLTFVTLCYVIKDTYCPLGVPLFMESNDGRVGRRHLSEFHITTFAELLTNQLPSNCWWKLKQRIPFKYDS